MPHFLHSLFHPQTIAVIGASDRYGSTGRNVFNYLLANQKAAVIPVNSGYKSIGGFKAYASLSEAVQEHAVDTAVVVLAAEKLSGIIREAAKNGIRQVVFINDLDTPPVTVQNRLERATAQAEKSAVHLIAIPASGLDGLYAAPADLPACAYIGQSAGIADCMRNYAAAREIGFSHFITLNANRYTVHLGDVIDYIAADPQTSALLVHISCIDDARKLVSALAAAAKHKPVVVLNTLAEPFEDEVLAHALSRKQILSVATLTEFLTAAKLIHTGIISRGNRLAIISNTPQISALALKTLPQTLELAQPSAATVRALSRLLPHKNHHTNPFYLNADSAPSIFQAAAEHYLQDENTDAVFLLYAGVNQTESLRIAKVTAALQSRTRKPLLFAWLGSADTAEVQALFNRRRALHFRQPEHALHALTQLNHYRSHQQQRYRASAFHDYRYAAEAAKLLHKHLKPLLPVAVLPAGKTNTAHLLKALRLENQTRSRKQNAGTVNIQWMQHDPFGRVLTLSNGIRSIHLLPPLTPETAADALAQLELDGRLWQNCLLDMAEIFSRLPEIHSAFLSLYLQDDNLICSDAKVNLQDPASHTGSTELFAPYPHHLERQLTLANRQQAYLRPIRPEDAKLIQDLIAAQSEESRFNRFMTRLNMLPPSLLARLSQPDYQRECALLVHNGKHEALAIASYTADSDGLSCEFGISIADKYQGQGLGSLLLAELIQDARRRGFQTMRAEILADNHPMQKLALKSGFTISRHPNDPQLLTAILPLLSI